MRDLVADVPTSRILHVSDLMKDGTGSEDRPRVAPSDPLELAIDHFLSGQSDLHVVDEGSAPMGLIARDGQLVLTGQAPHHG